MSEQPDTRGWLATLLTAAAPTDQPAHAAPAASNVVQLTTLDSIESALRRVRNDIVDLEAQTCRKLDDEFRLQCLLITRLKDHGIVAEIIDRRRQPQQPD